MLQFLQLLIIMYHPLIISTPFPLQIVLYISPDLNPNADAARHE